MFRGSVSRFSFNDYKSCHKSLVSKCRTLKLSNDNIEYICCICKNALRKGNIPNIAAANGLQLDEMPQQLIDLTSLEVMFISRRIPFMKLLGLPRGRQKAIHRCVVNIPVDPEESIAVLPRVPTPESVIAVKLKRKIQYRGHVVMQNIRPFKIKEALHLLKYGLQNPLYKDIRIEEDWEAISQESDPDLWASLTLEPNSHNIEDINTVDHGVAEETDSEQESDSEAQEDEMSKLSGIPFDSCLQPKAAVDNKNVLLNIAPGEGKRPQAFETDEKSEELSFPHLFPQWEIWFFYEKRQ